MSKFGDPDHPDPKEVGKDTQFKPGESGNPEGRPKGARSLSTIIRDMLENPDQLEWDKLPEAPSKVVETFKDSGIAPFEALVYVAFAEALHGNTKAMKWLSKSAYGDKLEITPPEGVANIFHATKLTIEVVDGTGSSTPDAQ
jgi:hypothetical protein